jgi:hypothetical protein
VAGRQLRAKKAADGGCRPERHRPSSSTAATAELLHCGTSALQGRRGRQAIDGRHDDPRSRSRCERLGRLSKDTPSARPASPATSTSLDAPPGRGRQAPGEGAPSAWRCGWPRSACAVHSSRR